MKDLQMKRALRSVLIVLLLSVVGMMKMYADVTIGNLTYSLSNSTLTATVTGHKDGTSATGELIIPEAVTYNGNTYTVTQIGNYAFNNCSGLTGSLTIPNSVTWIGGFAFHSCSGFSGSLTIPNSVTTMGGCVFSGCSGFTGRLTISNSIAIIGQMVFAGCTGLTSIEIPSSVTTIGAEAFASCNGLTSIEIPNSITTINSHAFSHCHGLTFVEISNSVTSIEGTAFSDCSGLGQIVVDSGNVVYDSRENCNAIIKTSNNELVVGCKYTVIPNSVTSIGDGAFYCCYGLTSIEIPNSVTSIGEGAFVGCSGLTSIEIPNSLTSIGGYAFRDCSGLTGSLTIPSSVTTIGDYAFYNCSGFTGNLIISNSVTTIGDSAFSGCIGFTGNLFIPNSVTYIGTNPFIDCTGLEHFIVDSGNTFYDSRENCNAIINTNTNELVAGCKYTFIPNSVTSIGSYAFSYCNSLTSIEIPNSVTSIGSYAFQYCDSLTSIEIPNSVTYIGEGAFYTCSGLTSIEFPNSVTSINNYLFMYCTRLNSIEIPNSVSYIGRYAFWDCTRLSSMSILADNPPTLDDNAFFGMNMRIPVYVPCESTEAYVAANWGSFNNFIGLCAGEITVIANPSEGGTVTGGGYYEGGATCTLTATANTGYAFINWTKDGEVVSDSEMYNFYVAGDASFVANFVAIPPVPVIAEYYPDPDEPNSPYVKVHWAAVTSDIMIGDETSSTYTTYMPFYTLYNYSISEALYTADELSAAGLTTAPMTSLSWEAIDVTTNQTQNNISIWMANVSDTELTTTSHLASNMTLVYTGNIGIPPLGWNEFVFNESNFVWDGTSNVLILCQRNNGQWNGSVRWRSHDPGFYGMAFMCQDYTPYDATSQTYTLTCSNTARPNIIMKQGAMTYNIYRANCDDSNTQLIAENLNDTQYIDETWWQLENGSYKYGVSITDSTHTDIFWSNCIENNFNPTAFHFITAGNWSDAANWQYGALPGVYDIVFIDAPCQLDMTTEVSELTVSNGPSLTLQPYKTLTVTGDLINTSTDGLVIKDGAQLVNASGNVAATLEKDIVAYSDSNPDAWYTIASPMDEMPISGSSFATPEFDLYRFNESNLTNEEWENYKGGLADFTTFENGRGYLFANSNAFSPAFTGTLNASAVSCPLSYTERPNDPLSGFNLIGNPFPHDIYKGVGAAIDNVNLASGYYTLTNEGTWQVHTFEDAIHPGQGILVKATAPTVLTIAKSNEMASSESGEAKGKTNQLRISVKGDNGQDQTYVYFGQGVGLDKKNNLDGQAPSLWVRANGNDYAIAHVDNYDESLELCFSGKQEGDFTLSVVAVNTKFTFLQLTDRVTGTTVDLLKQPNYSFHATGQEPRARFCIEFRMME